MLLTIDHPSGEIFTYNVDQKTKPWPVPVILVAPKDRSLLDLAQQSGRPVSVSVQGAWRRDVPGRNVVGRLDRGKGRWLAISTPVTSWFTSSCERGPGIAGFLAMARLAATRWPDVDLVFVATSGHEIGHGGMEHFLHDGAPRPDATLAWAHFGASLACFEWRRDGARWITDRQVDTRQRLVLSSQAMEASVARRFKDVVATPLTGLARRHRRAARRAGGRLSALLRHGGLAHLLPHPGRFGRNDRSGDPGTGRPGLCRDPGRRRLSPLSRRFLSPLGGRG